MKKAGRHDIPSCGRWRRLAGRRHCRRRRRPRRRTTPVVITTGEAIVKRAPDRAFVSISAESRARDVARGAEAERRRDVGGAAKLKGAGLRRRRHPDARLRPAAGVRLRQRPADAARLCRAQQRRVRVDDLPTLGELLEQAVAPGATSVSGVRFDLKDRSGCRARSAAAGRRRCARAAPTRGRAVRA